MNHRALVAIIMCGLVATGCGRYVSNKQFLNTAMTKDPKLTAAASTQVYAFVRSSDRSALDVQPYHAPAPVVIQSGNQGGMLGLDLTSQRGRMIYASDARNQIESLQRQLALITSRAQRKGAAAEAALQPEARSFVADSKSIDNELDRLERASNHRDALMPKAKVDVLLDQARADVQGAADAVDHVYSPQSGSNRP